MNDSVRFGNYSADLCLMSAEQMDAEKRSCCDVSWEHKCIVFQAPLHADLMKSALARQQQAHLVAVFSSSSPDPMQVCCWTISFGCYMSAVYLKLVRLLLFLPGRTPFQQDESGVMDLAGGWMAGSMLTYFSVECICVREILLWSQMCVWVCAEGCKQWKCICPPPLCDCVNQRI